MADVLFVLRRNGTIAAVVFVVALAVEVLTSKVAESPSDQKFFYNSIGLIKMPVSWSDENQNVYEVYAKGHLEMGGFVNLMERLEYIGKEIVYKQGNGQ